MFQPVFIPGTGQSSYCNTINSWSDIEGYSSGISQSVRGPRLAVVTAKSIIDIPGLRRRVGKSVLLLTINSYLSISSSKGPAFCRLIQCGFQLVL